MSYGRKGEEYQADFILVARRVLSPLEHRIFRFHYLLGLEWKLCCQHLGLPCVNKGDSTNFFHKCDNIERKLGHVFRTLEPYPLMPDQYFQSPERRAVA